MIAKSRDPKTDLRKEMTVEILKNTFLIRVALASRDPEEAALIVNSVVDAYLEQHGEYHRSFNKTYEKNLKAEKTLLDLEIAEKTKELKALYGTGSIAMKRPQVQLNTEKEDDPGIQSVMSTVTEEQFTQATTALLQTEMDTLETQADLEAAQEQLTKTTAALKEQEEQQELEQPSGELEERIQEEFLIDPEAKSLATQIKDMEGELENVKEKARMPNEPARLRAEKQLKKLKQDWQTLWDEKRASIARRSCRPRT